MSVNTNSVVFGTIVIGEKLVRKIQLVNKGALGTSFELMRMSEFKKLGSQGTSPDEKDEKKEEEPLDGIEMGEVTKAKLIYPSFILNN